MIDISNSSIFNDRYLDESGLKPFLIKMFKIANESVYIYIVVYYITINKFQKHKNLISSN